MGDAGSFLLDDPADFLEIVHIQFVLTLMDSHGYIGSLAFAHLLWRSLIKCNYSNCEMASS